MGRRSSVGQAGSLRVGNISIANNQVASFTANSNLILDANGTGVVTTADPLRVTNSTASSNSTTGAFTITGGLGVGGSLNIGGTLNGGALNNITLGQVTPASGNFTTLAASGLTTLAEVQEVAGTKTGATGTVIHDFTESNVWVHTSMSANFTVNLTNVPTTNDRIITINLILIQGATARFASGFQIDGVGQTIRFAGYTPPTPQANRFEIQSFNLVRSGGSWTVFSSLASYG